MTSNNKKLKLSISEEQFRGITEQSLMSILVIQDGLLKYFNDRIPQLNGYSREEIENWSPYEFMKVIHPEDKEFVLDQVRKKQTGAIDVIPQYRYRLIRKDKEVRWIENFSKTINYQGRPADLITSIDITDKIIAEQKLKESEERYRLIAENSDTVVWSTDMNLNIIYVSSNSPKILGYTAEEVKSSPITTKLTHESLKTVINILKEELKIERKKVKDLKRSRTFETEQIHKSGSIIPVEMMITFLRDNNGKAIGILGISKDISDRKKAEEAIHIEKKFTEDIINASNDTIFVFNPKTGKAIRWNDAFKRVSGYSDEEIASLKAPESYYSEVDLMKAEEATKRVLQGGKATLEMKLIIKNGSKIPYEYTGTILQDTDGTLLIVSIGRDITERKEIELKLKESEEKFRALVETTSDWIWEVDTNGIYMYSNPRIKDILGFEVEEVIGKHRFDLMPKEESERITTIFQNIKQEKKSLLSLENVNVHKDGHLITLETSGVPFFDKNGELLGYRGIDRNITEKKQAEIKLRESEIIFRDLYEEAPNAYFSIGKDKSIIRCNNAAERLLGYTKDELLKMKIFDLYSENEYGLERAKNVFKRFLDGEFVKDVELQMKNKNGEPVWISLSVKPIFDDDGNVIESRSIVLDITERKNTEKALKESEKKYKDAFDKANFYRDLFTHDINNILQIINSSAELISLQLGDSEKSRNLENMTKMIKSQVERGSKLVSNVRTLTELEQEKLSKNRIDINLFLQKSIEFVKKAYSERELDISLNFANEENFTEANELLQDVFENVLINGIRYNENSNIKLNIKISKQIFDGKNLFKIEFVDNGIGVADNRKKIIFQRGNRELKGSKGMGLGLSLVSEILKTFNGKIWVEDIVKGDYTKGSKFIILLPEIK
ncbi:MAG: PAS domain S-box protein [Promethearchaeota archaeon]